MIIFLVSREIAATRASVRLNKTQHYIEVLSSMPMNT